MAASTVPHAVLVLKDTRCLVIRYLALMGSMLEHVRLRASKGFGAREGPPNSIADVLVFEGEQNQSDRWSRRRPRTRRGWRGGVMFIGHRGHDRIAIGRRFRLGLALRKPRAGGRRAYARDGAPGRWKTAGAV